MEGLIYVRQSRRIWATIGTRLGALWDTHLDTFFAHTPLFRAPVWTPFPLRGKRFLVLFRHQISRFCHVAPYHVIAYITYIPYVPYIHYIPYNTYITDVTYITHLACITYIPYIPYITYIPPYYLSCIP